MNSVTCVGIVNGDARKFENATSGTQAVHFTVRDAWKMNDEWRDVIFKCRVFGKRADTILQYFPKGKPISITGKITGLNEWTSQSGRVYKEIVVDVQDFAFVPREASEALLGNVGSTPGSSANDDLPEIGDLPF